MSCPSFHVKDSWLWSVQSHKGKSLDDYCDARKTAGLKAFRGCLPKVKAWLQSFDLTKKPNDLLVDQILSMINTDTEERHTAEQAVSFLKPERAFFYVE